MNTTIEESNELASKITNYVTKIDSIDIVLCPPFTSLESINNIIKDSHIHLSAQNVNEHENGAFTGEISAEMVKFLDVQYAIIGHSERRQYFFETDTQVNGKIKSALSADLCPVVCVGESLEERESGKTNEVLKKQLMSAFNDIDNTSDRLVVAYEPVWAIGTGRSADSNQVYDAHNFINEIFEKFKLLADKKKHVYDEDIIALIDDSLIIDNKVSAINLKSLKVFAGTGEPQRAEMTLDVFGEIKKASETGDGPVDAIFKCIKKLYPHEVNLQLYQVHAVTEGTDAQATVSVKIEENGKTTVGQAADTDTLVASANAYINSLNKMIIKRDKTAPGTNIENQNFENQKMKGI